MRLPRKRPTPEALADFLRQHPTGVTRSHLQRHYEISRASIRLTIDEAIAEGLVVCEGRSSGARYVTPCNVDTLRLSRVDWARRNVKQSVRAQTMRDAIESWCATPFVHRRVPVETTRVPMTAGPRSVWDLGVML